MCVCEGREGGVTVTQMGNFIDDRNTRVQKQGRRACVRLAKKTNFFVLLFFPFFFRTSKGSLACDKYHHSSQEKHICSTRAPRCLFLIGIDSLHMLPARHVKNIYVYLCVYWGYFGKTPQPYLRHIPLVTGAALTASLSNKRKRWACGERAPQLYRFPSTNRAGIVHFQTALHADRSGVFSPSLSLTKAS